MMAVVADMLKYNCVRRDSGQIFCAGAARPGPATTEEWPEPS